MLQPGGFLPGVIVGVAVPGLREEPQLPFAALVDEKGIVAAAGLVNTREHLESLIEAKRSGVASIQDWLEQAER